ncbi:MAG: type II secretion system protein [Bacilli bacterium]|nr:type II secretion system protein [Bacilli bacterium]
MKKIKRKAFTLVELLVVIAILAVLASVSVVGYLGFTSRAKESKALTELTQYKTVATANLVTGNKVISNEEGKVALVSKSDKGIEMMLYKGSLEDAFISFVEADDDADFFFKVTNEDEKFIIDEIVYSIDDNVYATWNVISDEVSSEHQHKLKEVKNVSVQPFVNGDVEYKCDACGNSYHEIEAKKINNDTLEDVFKTPLEYGKVLAVDNGIKIAKDNDGSGPTTYFTETDKNLDWDGSATTVSFDLDLSSMENNDNVQFSLGFNGTNGSQNTEIMVGLAKSNDKYYALAPMTNCFSDDAGNWGKGNLAVILRDGEEINNSKVTVSMKLEVIGDTIHYDIKVANYEKSGDHVNKIANIGGFRYLWNTYNSIEDVNRGIVFSNLNIK